MKIHNQKLVDRWNSVVYEIGCEYLVICENCELSEKKNYYDVENGITVGWMYSEATYWLSCYYETGNCRCDDRFIDDDNYKIWKSETGKLKRLIAKLEKMENILVVEW